MIPEFGRSPEKKMAIHSSILAWWVTWKHDQVTNTFSFHHIRRRLEVSRTQMKMTLFTNMRSFSNFSKQWGVIQRLQTSNLQWFQKNFSKKKKTEGDPNKRQGEMLSSWFKELLHSNQLIFMMQVWFAFLKSNHPSH